MAIAPERGKAIFAKSARDLDRLSSKQTPENIHSFRTTVLRLETLLENLAPGRDRGRKKLLKTLNRIRKRAGKVRDIDVQLAALRSLKVAQEPRRKTQLVQDLIELRVKHEKKLDKSLNKKELRELRQKLKRTGKTVRFDKALDPLVAARDILKSAAPPDGTISEAVLHRYRIAVKRARYAAEFAPKSEEAGRFIAQLKPLQDALGQWHDWLILSHTAIEQLGEVNQSSLVAVLHNVTRGRFRQAVGALSNSQINRPATKPRPAPSLNSGKTGTRKLLGMQKATVTPISLAS